MGCFRGEKKKKYPGIVDTGTGHPNTSLVTVNPGTAASNIPGKKAIMPGSFTTVCQTSPAAAAVADIGATPTSAMFPNMPAEIELGDDPFAFLEDFNTCFLIDDSKEMEDDWHEVLAFVREVAPICVERDPRGVEILFGNHSPASSLWFDVPGHYGYLNIGLMRGAPQMHNNVEGIFNDVKPTGSKKVTFRLTRILNHYIPLNLIVVTGRPLSNRIPGIFQGLAKELDKLDAPSYQVGVQFFRVGGNEEAEEHMRLLDDEVHRWKGVRDFVDTATWTDGQEDYHWKAY
ncbi:hypothetical protein TruAng_001637 [Truncatella angustata]|nr:hypothetical protein TruAng_001637 [Truncatella angustata]